jgi:CheY-like chemotaxis protein
MLSSPSVSPSHNSQPDALHHLIHDLRSPLNAILGLSEALLDNLCGELSDRQRKAIQTIDAAGNSLLRQIDSLPSFFPDTPIQSMSSLPLLDQASQFSVSKRDQLKRDQQPKYEPLKYDPSKRDQPLLLVADDNAINAEMLMDYFSEEGFYVLTTCDGASAIKMIQQYQPDLVLMDVMMPIIDGLTAIAQIRADAQMPQPPIVALTALALAGDSDRCLQAGATAYFSKPIKLQPLLSLVQSLLAT